MMSVSDMTDYAAQGKLALQRCQACDAVQYPPRDLCVKCLEDSLEWRVQDFEDGEVLAVAILCHSHDQAFRGRLPLHIGLIRFDSGPSAVCFLDDTAAAGSRVRVRAMLDLAGRAVLQATSLLP